MSHPVKTTQSTAPSTTSSSKPPSIAGSSSSQLEKDPVKAMRDLENRTKAVNTNSIARTANSYLLTSDDKLHPLVSIKTNKAIDRFPETSKGVGKLSATLVDSILLALDADRSGTEEVKRERLRVQIGLRARPA